MQLDSQDVLLSQGDPADFVYFVFCGKLRVYAYDSEGEEIVFSHLSNGDSIGEMAVLSGHKRSATVQATRFSILMRISSEMFMQILKMDAELPVSISKQLVNRLELSNERARAHRLFDSGYIYHAVTGSAGLPMAASPLISEGDMHVDGCVLNTMPVDIAKQRYGGEVICVQIARDSTYPRDTEHSLFPSSWQILRRMLNPFKKNFNVPLLTEIMTKTIQMANFKKTNDMAEIADVVIAPDLSSVTPSDHYKAREIAELGYNEAKIQIEKWLAKKKASKN